MLAGVMMGAGGAAPRILAAGTGGTLAGWVLVMPTGTTANLDDDRGSIPGASIPQLTAFCCQRDSMPDHEVDQIGVSPAYRVGR